MHRTHPRWSVALLTLASLSCSDIASAEVSTGHATIATLIDRVTENSATFRGLLAAVDAANGIVYVTPGRCGRLRGCLVHRITSRAQIGSSPSSPTPRRRIALTAAVAYELQHAQEVLSDRRITSDAAILAFFWSHGMEMRGVRETRAAIETGDAVRRELRRASRR